MAGARYPIQMVNGVPVVAAPAAVDASNAGWLRAVLLEAACRGHGTFVVDMTGTRLCDAAGSVCWCGRTTGSWPKAASCGS